MAHGPLILALVLLGMLSALLALLLGIYVQQRAILFVLQGGCL